MTYTELKQFFEKNQHSLPPKMSNKFMLVFDVKAAVKINIDEVERELLKYGKEIKKSAPARAAKARLENLREMFLDETTHTDKLLLFNSVYHAKPDINK